MHARSESTCTVHSELYMERHRMNIERQVAHIALAAAHSNAVQLDMEENAQSAKDADYLVDQARIVLEYTLGLNCNVACAELDAALAQLAPSYAAR